MTGNQRDCPFSGKCRKEQFFNVCFFAKRKEDIDSYSSNYKKMMRKAAENPCRKCPNAQIYFCAAIGYECERFMNYTTYNLKSDAASYA